MTLSDFKPETWTTSSIEALKISLVGENAIQFPPNFTHAIFGETEQIFGYKDLIIHLVFDSVTFKPFFNIKYSKKLDNDEIDDIKAKLLNYLPKEDVVFKDEEKWIDQFEHEQKTFELPDDSFKINEYSADDGDFIIFKQNVNVPFCEKLHRRIQILSLFFIDGASYIDANDSNWEIFWLFDKNSKKCIGFSTTYKYWTYINAEEFNKENNLKYRAKISQFLILPPYQNKGHGTKFYESIVDFWMKESSIIEITVEDPNESFDDLRDRCDLNRLYEKGFFQEVTSVKEFDEKWYSNNKSKFKLETRQFKRLVEMILLYKESSLFPQQVKIRLYQKNCDALKAMEEEDQIEALDKQFNLLKEDYTRILMQCKFLKRKIKLEDSTPSLKKKRV
ncbi:hypothetical protein TBLA_0B04840 [Henningerozyma blattae CBS 6284]|uniref:Histone acetyltransferase type B catalytic subunit n=1 Tax=Henningerozyma blattae (strain ATCC 34711 / CBS 6284 / DSM 70876 / NBRC 10599 / NRRL Y-10934 / UCD 77-7) TaxID=1071380 RepID=I2GYW6_HENB6|nr:hypothetical protein TBLA_0B04840 [Tetrapisispora blattae CBS 6284]CCH59318.1 hypothetical protein TBLA_0B04840 [Tetrapisispora blattae CBS 6284]